MREKQAMGLQGEIGRPGNQIEQLEKEVAALKELVDDQKAELLQLYRRIHQNQLGSPRSLAEEAQQYYR